MRYNVGNEYFGAGDAVVFTDLDVLAVDGKLSWIEREL